MAAKAKAHILPWVDNILSRMIFYFRYSSWVRPPPPPPALGSGHVRPWSSLFPVPSCALAPRRRPRQDETLKQSFLAAILMLVGAISRNEGAHSYEFSQLPELFECLMVRAGPGAEAEAGGRPPPGPAASTRGPRRERGRLDASSRHELLAGFRTRKHTHIPTSRGPHTAACSAYTP